MKLLYNSDAIKFTIFVFVLFASALILDAIFQEGDITGQASFKSLGKKLKKEIQHAMGQLPKPPPAPAPLVCTDSDNTYFVSTPGGGSYNPPGQDRYVAGTVTYGQQKYTDYCANQVFYKDLASNNLVRYDKTTKGAYILEMGCIDGKTPKETTPFKCLGECQNGACVKPFQPPTPPTQAVSPTPTKIYDVAVNFDSKQAISIQPSTAKQAFNVPLEPSVPFTVHFSITNKGTVPAQPMYEIRTGIQSLFLGYTKTKIQPGETITITDATIGLLAGQHPISIILTPLQRINEGPDSHPNDNSQSFTITVTPPKQPELPNLGVQLRPISTKPQAKPAGTSVEKTITVVLPQEVGV